jgi:nicotinate-nucleotide adenylyltransferase
MSDVAFFGGSFNPPHVAHVLATAYLRSVLGLPKVLVVPVFAHAFDKPLAGYEHRVRMCELAFSFASGVEVSREEEQLGTPSRTLRTLESIQARHPEWRLRLVIGADVLFETHKWHGFARIAEIAPPLVLGRAGVSHPDAPVPILPDVSSTRVRRLLAQRADPGAESELEALVPRAVLEYIERAGLYREIA